MACHLIDPDARQDALAAAQRLNMARSAHAYVRGNTAQFYDWLRHLKRATYPKVRLSGFVGIATSEI
jgi:Uncharacterized protein conserved in bacteria (DUF2252)